MKNRTRIITIIALACLLVSLIGCGSSKNKLVGSWVNTNDRTDQVTFYKDGTGMADGISCNWNASNGQLTLTAWFGSVTYDYSFRGSNLVIDGDVYKRVN